MKEYLAHSAKGPYPAQTYASHINGVCSRADRYAADAERYAAKNSGALAAAVQKGASLHDLGKLDDENQAVLQDNYKTRRRLPINHTDAGSAVLKADKSLYAALAVYSHHKGLPDIQAELLREEAVFRDKHPATRNHVDSSLDKLLRRHRAFFPSQYEGNEPEYNGDQAVFFRMILSCLADADHTDTAVAYGQAPKQENLPQLHAKERLEALDRYVSGLGCGSERSRLRQEMYSVCRNAEISGSFSACDSPVGSGKTTAVMAHLLQQSIKRNARHIFVVLPYTSIIQQSADVYRKALVLPGENPEEVVAELHSRADFQDCNARYLTSLWRAPIIVTTAVAFFETMSSCRPSTLRRFHELPGSVIFVDEAHNALPLKLLPLAWRWMNVLADEWSCYWVLASGSLVRYWQLERLSEIKMPHPTINELVYPDLQKQLTIYEHSRIAFRWRSVPISRQELVEWVQNVPGPRLLILNTVQSAAVIAADLSDKYGRGCTEHLSTALTPEDRSTVIAHIKRRLKDSSDTNWTLVATSCVETGIDFSFRTGFREISSLLSLLQTAGRINRHGKFKESEIWSFSLQDDYMLKQNKSLEYSAAVLKDYFSKGLEIVPELSTCSMNDEIIRDDSCIQIIRRLIKKEETMQFQTVDNEFKVIDSDTVSAIIDPSFAKEIACGRGDWKMLQKKSVSIRRSKIKAWNLKEITSEVYQWTLGYDDFLGYMYGVLNPNIHAHETGKN